jgi:hypothetical protein
MATTEWADIQYKHGNKVGAYADPELEQKILQQKMQHEIDDVLDAVVSDQQYRDMRTKEHEDDVREKSDSEDDEEAAMKRMREKRLKELHAQAARPQWGTIKTISRDEYMQEVNGAPKGVWVILLLVTPSNGDCDFLANILNKLAAKHRFVKFVAGFVREIIGENFPEKQCPVVMFYKDGTSQKTVTGLEPWGGRKTTEAEVESALRAEGILPREGEE